MSTTSVRMFPAVLQSAVQARRCYLQAAEIFRRADLYVVSHAFLFTAAQEKEHAAILRSLSDAEEAACDAPAPLPDEPARLLRHAIRQETTCAESLFPAAAREADAAGLPRAAVTLRRIAETEHQHARRFRQYLDALEDGTLLNSPVRISWVCLSCGCLHHGCDAPPRCDSCGSSRGHFIRSDFSPFAIC